MLMTAAGESSRVSDAHATATLADEEAAAVARAKEALAKRLSIPADSVNLTSVEPRTWSDSSMGCGKPGIAAMQVLTSGYAVLLRTEERAYEVHVSQNAAAVCDAPPLARRDLQRASYARGLDAAIDAARRDLAERLSVDAATIHVIGMRPNRWPDSALGCPAPGEEVKAGTVAGYQLSLKHLERVYTYHTDLQTVRACPPIEAE